MIHEDLPNFYFTELGSKALPTFSIIFSLTVMAGVGTYLGNSSIVTLRWLLLLSKIFKLNQDYVSKTNCFSCANINPENPSGGINYVPN